ncbi:late embryogenesis abundant [Micractinium conductrix]|uniref:Late embryogenesis abundant n=1 Tax=Micractinium conductrix TaxID=554055 RepID=A0A2P6V8N7_9CHLO|nr:late embryogenesis abundant [Micractinium conductrix]|eukprot:PSC70456.1 late embryogenesis abundant [Micractinium conductrix]
MQSEIDSINDAFVEARDEIEYAKEEAETVYFNESCDTARQAVAGVLDKYAAVLQRLSEQERGKLQRSMGLKMEQLKAEVADLDTLHD